MKYLIRVLRFPIFCTTNKTYALKSKWMWSEDYRGDVPIFRLSILGIINGFLPSGKKLGVIVSTKGKWSIKVIKTFRR